VRASKRFESNSHAVPPLKGHLYADYVKTDLVFIEEKNIDCKKQLMMSSIKTLQPASLKKDPCHLHKILKYFGFVMTKVDICAALKEKRG